MAKAKNMVIAGDYKGYVVTATFGGVVIGSWGKTVKINPETVKHWRIEYGGKISTISIAWSDGKKSLLEVDDRKIRAIRAAMFEKIDKTKEAEKEKNREVNRKSMSTVLKILAVVLVVFVLFAAISPKSDIPQDGQSSTSSEQSGKTYEITGGVIGDYGRKVTLNANTDMPIDRYLQKIPAGTYKVSTDQKVTTYVGIVKDTTSMTGNERYPEELQYVVTQQFEPGETFELTLAEDESFLIYDGDKVTFKEIK